MAGGREYSRYQRGIINRYYEHLDTITLGKLGEIVGDLVLADSEQAREKLWKRAETALANVSGNNAEIKKILETRDASALAALINRMG